MRLSAGPWLGAMAVKLWAGVGCADPGPGPPCWSAGELCPREVIYADLGGASAGLAHLLAAREGGSWPWVRFAGRWCE